MRISELTFEPCDYYPRYQGIYPPRCSCFPCFAKFQMNLSYKRVTAYISIDGGKKKRIIGLVIPPEENNVY